MPIHDINIPMPVKYRSKVTKIILDWVEKMPKFQGGSIHLLQRERESQREEAIETFDRTRPPKGTELDFLALRMIEVFHYEDFQILRTGLERMYPDLEIGIGNPFKAYFDEFSSSLIPGWRTNIGWMYRSQKPLGPQNCFHAPNLPQEVDTIEISLHKILPSIIVVVLDVQLNKTASAHLKKLQESKYLGEARIESLSLLGKFFGMSRHTAERSMEQTIAEWHKKIREGIEDSINHYLAGDFMREYKLAPKLPAVEIYGLKTHLKTKNGFVVWAKSCRAWCESLGFRLYSGTYHNSNFSYSWSHQGIYNETLIPHRIVVFEDIYLKSINLNMYSGDERFAIVHSMRDFLDGIVAPLSAIEFLTQETEKVKEFRTDIYSSMVKGKHWYPKFRKQISLYGNLQQEIRKAERFLIEFDDAKKYIERDFKGSNSQSLLYTDLLSRRKKRRRFDQDIFNAIDLKRKIFNTHMNFLNKSFSSYVELLNVDSIYGLQVVSIVLSVIALVAAIFGGLGNWKEIIQLFK